MKFGKLKIKHRKKKGGVKITWKENRNLSLVDIARKAK